MKKEEERKNKEWRKLIIIIINKVENVAMKVKKKEIIIKYTLKQFRCESEETLNECE